MARTLGWEVSEPQKDAPSPNLVVICQTVGAYLRRSAWKMTLRVRLSRSLKVVGTDTDRSATYDFLSVNSGS